MKRAYIALGTNIEPRLKHLEEAIESIKHCKEIEIKQQSSIYETAPVGYTDQAHFLNMIIEVETSYLPIELLDFCQSIEVKLGRKRTIRFGPRTIDLDILVYNEETVDDERLNIPHPRMHERAFVLIPLAEIAPELNISQDNKLVCEFLEQLPSDSITEVVKWTDNS